MFKFIKLSALTSLVIAQTSFTSKDEAQYLEDPHSYSLDNLNGISQNSLNDSKINGSEITDFKKALTRPKVKAYPTGVYPPMGNQCVLLTSTTYNCSANGSAPFVTYNYPSAANLDGAQWAWDSSQRYFSWTLIAANPWNPLTSWFYDLNQDIIYTSQCNEQSHTTPCIPMTAYQVTQADYQASYRTMNCTDTAATGGAYSTSAPQNSTRSCTETLTTNTGGTISTTQATYNFNCYPTTSTPAGIWCIASNYAVLEQYWSSNLWALTSVSGTNSWFAYCNYVGPLSYKCVSYNHMKFQYQANPFSSVSTSQSGYKYSNSLATQNPASPLSYTQLISGYNVSTLTSTFPVITTSTCSSGSNCAVGSICTSSSQCATGSCCGYVYLNQWTNTSNTACQQNNQTGQQVKSVGNGNYQTSNQQAYNLFVGCSYSSQRQCLPSVNGSSNSSYYSSQQSIGIYISSTNTSAAQVYQCQITFIVMQNNKMAQQMKMLFATLIAALSFVYLNIV